MFGIAILFFLGLWIAITIFATIFGAKKAGKKGAFVGFMLTMGGFIMYWTIEYYQIKSYVTSTCKAEGGVKVYVTPEEFKERLKSNNWEGLPKYTALPKGDEKNEEYILFEEKEYKGFRPDTSIPEITIYRYRAFPQRGIIHDKKIYVYNQPRVVLTAYTSVLVGAGSIANNLRGLRFWINSIKDCRTSYHYTNDGKISMYKKELKNER